MSIIDVLILFCFLSAVFFSSKPHRVTNLNSYCYCENKISSFALFTVVFGTLFTAVSLFNTSEKVKLFGFSYFIFACSDGIRSLMICFFIPLIFNYKHNLSIGQTIGNFYGSWSQLITGLCGLIFATSIIMFQIKWIYITIDCLFNINLNVSFLITIFLGIYIFYALKKNLNLFNLTTVGIILLISCAVLYYLCQINQKITVYIITIGLVFYSSISGNRHIPFRSMMEFSLVVLILPILFSEINNLDAPLDQIFKSLPNEMTSLKLEMFDPENFKKYLMIFLTTSIPIFNPLVIQRIKLANNYKQARNVFILASIAVFIFIHLVSLCSLVNSYLNPEIGANNSFNAFLYLIESIISSKILKGLVLCGILSVMFSTIDAGINSANICLINDIIKNKILPNIDDKYDYLMIKITTAIICCVTVLISHFSSDLMSVIIFAVNIWASIVTIPFIIKLCNINVPNYTFYVCALCGIAINILYYIYDIEITISVVSSSLIIESIVVCAVKFMLQPFITKLKLNT